MPISSNMPSTPEKDEPVEAFDKEELVKRNPHPDFGLVESQRPEYQHGDSWIFTKSPNPTWSLGDGADGAAWKGRGHVHIDPHEEGRPEVLNYKLMISATVPRPVALVSTVSNNGARRNLAPFSYFQCVIADVSLARLQSQCLLLAWLTIAATFNE